MRDLTNVINDIIEVIPKSKECIVSTLEDIKDSVGFSAPELMYMWWEETHDALIDCISENPTEDWEYQAWSIFTTKSVEELKDIFSNIK